MIAETADWCVSEGGVSISGTRMKESSRDSMGERWCFTCRARHEFWWVVMVPDGFSYYGPFAKLVGTKSGCSDLFPGWFRSYEED